MLVEVGPGEAVELDGAGVSPVTLGVGVGVVVLVGRAVGVGVGRGLVVGLGVGVDLGVGEGVGGGVLGGGVKDGGLGLVGKPTIAPQHETPPEGAKRAQAKPSPTTTSVAVVPPRETDANFELEAFWGVVVEVPCW